MAEIRVRWDPAAHAGAYRELEHPSDLFLEIRGRDLVDLFQNALFAFYGEVASLEQFDARRELTLRVREPGLDRALRALLAEALYHLDTDRFVAVGAEVRVERSGDRPATGRPATPGRRAGEGLPDSGRWWTVVATLWGESADREGRRLQHEIKAVTYHRLEVREGDGGWTATVLLDV